MAKHSSAQSRAASASRFFLLLRRELGSFVALASIMLLLITTLLQENTSVCEEIAIAQVSSLHGCAIVVRHGTLTRKVLK
jgi:hypothetical protein